LRSFISVNFFKKCIFKFKILKKSRKAAALDMNDIEFLYDDGSNNVQIESDSDVEDSNNNENEQNDQDNDGIQNISGSPEENYIDSKFKSDNEMTDLSNSYENDSR
jgi:hypothetical protein